MVHGQSSGGLAGPASVRAPGAAENPEPTGSESSGMALLDFVQGSAQSRRGRGVRPLPAGALQPDQSVCCPEEAQERPGSGPVITAAVAAMGSPVLVRKQERTDWISKDQNGPDFQCGWMQEPECSAGPLLPLFT